VYLYSGFVERLREVFLPGQGGVRLHKFLNAAIKKVTRKDNQKACTDGDKLSIKPVGEKASTSGYTERDQAVPGEIGKNMTAKK